VAFGAQLSKPNFTLVHTLPESIRPKSNLPKSNIQIKAGCCLLALLGITYAFLADQRTELRLQRDSHDFERRSTRIIALRSYWDCLCTAGFKRNKGEPKHYRLQSR
jgi:hypothetical protein